MRLIIATTLLFGPAFAAPKPESLPQGINFDVIDAVPEPEALGPEVDVTVETIPYDRESAVAAASFQVLATAVPVANKKRNTEADEVAPACETEEQPAGQGIAGPLINDPDTSAVSRENEVYALAANGATAPGGYTEAFKNLKASVEQIGYLGVRTIKSYDPQLCAAQCDPGQGCLAFNIYFKREPSFDTNSGSCSNPPSTTNIKCTLYGFPVSAEAATNKGSFLNRFEVATAGSNGYTRSPILSPRPNGGDYNSPTELQCAINAPLDPETRKNTHVGTAAFKTAFDPAQCAAACNTHNQYHTSRPNAEDGTYPACNFFNSYVLYKNNVPESLVCTMYSRSWDESLAVNCGQWRGQDHYTIG